jgi:hypothetical protein
MRRTLVKKRARYPGVEADAEHRGRLELVAAGELSREETERLEARMFGHMVGHNGASPP